MPNSVQLSDDFSTPIEVDYTYVYINAQLVIPTASGIKMRRPHVSRTQQAATAKRQDARQDPTRSSAKTP